MNEAFAEREKSGKVQNDMIDTLLELRRQDKDTVKAEGELIRGRYSCCTNRYY